MLKIGLTYTGIDKKHEYYQQWLKGQDDIEVIRLSEAEGNADEIATCDGLVLSGGIDIHPEWYMGQLDYPNKPEEGWDKKRDIFEKTVFEAALGRKIPILGICRGLQLINILLKGTLIQDLGNESGNMVHIGIPDDKQHPVEIEKDSFLYRITGQLKGPVNSAHHQAIDKLGEGLRINSKTADGVIEGIEWADGEDKPFLLGIQWHAERMFRFNLQDSPLSANIRNQFINEIRKSKSIIQ